MGKTGGGGVFAALDGLPAAVVSALKKVGTEGGR